MSKITREKNDFFIAKPCASVSQIGVCEDTDTINGIRAYKDSPSTLLVQIRAFGPIHSGGIKRMMIAHVSLKVDETEALRDELSMLIDVLKGGK